MKHTSPFVISEFANPSGKIAFQLYARLDGKRFRKNFQTRAEAEAERQVQEMQLLQRETGSRVAATRLTDEQLHEAESVFCRIAGHAHSLSFYVEFALTNYRAPVMQKPLAEAIAAFVASKDHEREQDLLSKSHLERVKRDLRCLQRHFPGEHEAGPRADAPADAVAEDARDDRADAHARVAEPHCLLGQAERSRREEDLHDESRVVAGLPAADDEGQRHEQAVPRDEAHARLQLGEGPRPRRQGA